MWLRDAQRIPVTDPAEVAGEWYALARSCCRRSDPAMRNTLKGRRAVVASLTPRGNGAVSRPPPWASAAAYGSSSRGPLRHVTSPPCGGTGQRTPHGAPGLG